MTAQQELKMLYTIGSSLPRRRPAMMRDGVALVARDPGGTAQENLKDIAEAAQEMFVVLTINTKNKIIGKYVVGVGLVDQCPAHPREVFRPAIVDCAHSVIVAHNHPSGEVSPSAEDLRITRQLIEAGKILGIHVIDSIVVGINDTNGELCWFSMREEGLVQFS